MKNLKFSRLFAAFAFVAILSLAGCKPVTEEVIKEVEVTKEKEVEKVVISEGLLGTWANSQQKFIIQTNTFRNIGYDTWTDPSNPAWVETYTGNTLCVRYTSATSGYVYMKYTKAITPSWTYSTDSSEAPDVGKWYALAFKELNTAVTPNTIKISGAYKDSGETSTDTLDEAIDTFTIEEGYFGTFDDLVKE